MERDTITKATYLNKALNWRLVYSFRGRVHTHHGLEQGSRQLGTRLEQELRACIWSIGSRRERERWEKRGGERKGGKGIWSAKAFRNLKANSHL